MNDGHTRPALRHSQRLNAVALVRARLRFTASASGAMIFRRAVC
jgi:hypothetical protein